MTDRTPPPGKSSIIQNPFVGKHDMVLLVLNSFQVAKASHISFIRMIDGNLIFLFFLVQCNMTVEFPIWQSFLVRCSQDDKPTSKKGLKKQQKEAEKLAKKAQRQAEVCINGVGYCVHMVHVVKCVFMMMMFVLMIPRLSKAISQ